MHKAGREDDDSLAVIGFISQNTLYIVHYILDCTYTIVDSKVVARLLIWLEGGRATSANRFSSSIAAALNHH